MPTLIMIHVYHHISLPRPRPSDSALLPLRAAGNSDTRQQRPTRNVVLEAATLDTTPICLTIQPPLIGGLSNSVGVVNDVLQMVAKSKTWSSNVRVVTPDFKVLQTHTGSRQQLFADLFTSPLPAMRIVPKEYARTIKDLGVPYVWSLRKLKPCDGFQGRCSLRKLALNGTVLWQLNMTALALKYADTPSFRSPEPWDGSGIFNGCKVVLVAMGSQLTWNLDYITTYPAIRRMFWSGRPLPATCR